MTTSFPSEGARSKLFLGGYQGQRTGVAVTTVSNALILGGWVTKNLREWRQKIGGGGVEGWLTTIF